MYQIGQATVYILENKENLMMFVDAHLLTENLLDHANFLTLKTPISL